MPALKSFANSLTWISLACWITFDKVKKQKRDAIVTKQAGTPPDISVAQLGGLALLTSLFSFFYYYQHHDLLLYGDAVAHINIARRVFDSQTPGLLQLGTVWLPLPHLLMIPFVFADKLWQNGAGGSFPSMVAYVFGVVGIFQLVRGFLASNLVEKPEEKMAASVGAWIAAFVYAANPNLIYLQTTAMTESLYLCLFIWAVVFFARFLELSSRENSLSHSKAHTKTTAMNDLMRCGLCLAAAELTRYDGWFLAGGLAICVLASVAARNISSDRNDIRTARKFASMFLGIIACPPLLWLAYNRAIYGNALEFATGSFSAKAIQSRVNAPNPALHNLLTAGTYFLKSAQLNMAAANWGRLWLAAAICALLLITFKMRRRALPFSCLLLPIPFYAYSIAYGSVPIHVSTWWPFATFNQRYGLQLLPLFAVSAGLLAAFLFRLSAGQRHRWKIATALLALVVVSYASVWRAEPQCFTEARRNWALRHPLNASVQRLIATFPHQSIYLMDLSEHVGVMEQAGIPLRQVINSENRRLWMRPDDPNGVWERALADPVRHVDFVIAFDGDLVDRLVDKSNLFEYAELDASGQGSAKIYATNRLPAHAQ